MPMPKAKKGESKQGFISRCIARLTKDERDKFPAREQRAAICYSEWGETPEERKKYDAARKRKREKMH
ncbi:hypothetical protein NB640_12615 [Oxalobacter vibrioformis]|uniref:Uncharacterized protein n=1 Tax=Oxalobacter vibrioformis TaxID=933080 RepID=A0A9E9LWB9_9BURK|nr:hypothetical protein [Oxalobacter vibrioformis]NLC23973.1 hypothetical protein [Oxalobacter sp.]WAW10039.1 hypothetical protein NB640_12615 [Oxalobacter vibrioformis]